MNTFHSEHRRNHVLSTGEAESNKHLCVSSNIQRFVTAGNKFLTGSQLQQFAWCIRINPSINRLAIEKIFLLRMLRYFQLNVFIKLWVREVDVEQQNGGTFCFKALESLQSFLHTLGFIFLPPPSQKKQAQTTSLFHSLVAFQQSFCRGKLMTLKQHESRLN